MSFVNHAIHTISLQMIPSDVYDALNDFFRNVYAY